MNPLLGLSLTVHGRNLSVLNTQNFAQSKSQQVENWGLRPMSSSTGISFAAGLMLRTVQYFDGLCRPLQTVQVSSSANGTKDIIQPVAYDQYGRQVNQYIPYMASPDSRVLTGQMRVKI